MTNRVDPAARAAACARLAAVAQAEGLSAAADPSFAGHLRHLYENSALPVREIAHIGGIIERTLYAHAQRGGWQRRNWRHARYRGGRIVAIEEAGFPDACGHAALASDDAARIGADYAQARRLTEAASAAAAATDRERTAQREAERIARAARDNAEARICTWEALDRALDQLIEAQAQGGAAADNPGTQLFVLRVNALLGQLEQLPHQSGIGDLDPTGTG